MLPFHRAVQQLTVTMLFSCIHSFPHISLSPPLPSPARHPLPLFPLPQARAQLCSFWPVLKEGFDIVSLVAQGAAEHAAVVSRVDLLSRILSSEGSFDLATETSTFASPASTPTKPARVREGQGNLQAEGGKVGWGGVRVGGTLWAKNGCPVL